MRRRRVLMGLALLPLNLGRASAPPRPLTVFAAASLTEVMQRLGAAYAAAGGATVRFSFAASSSLARQIEAGAPADVFIPADQEWMDYLAARALIAPESRFDLVSNTLVLVAPADSRLRLRLARGVSFRAALGPAGRIATGDPAAVPVGRYARAALAWVGAWREVEHRLVAADNVRTALNFVARGEVPLGVVYGTDARGEPRVRVVDTFPPESHPRITYPAAATSTAGAAAARFLGFLRGAEARAILQEAGFGRP